ncbi:polyhydroxyalkanoate depolymerase [Aquisalinus flavus]|uniref:Esterase n=1 Tax=Aquisalinus flavus TaxID=1526572 RepID=A0A8J2V792_9PROT|nr:polyhydroxyalkanoate depolymerase [Aquisalinus flavus]MBD0425425.1 polyhydroxyalkanoate depolymerase [Aquisalinus flavus]UNE48934.1 polyhydroxyalkanoate depolymerase [Aquisalinus flavus]GGD16176.1 esterase [Aquisalinus flavus]
MLYTAYELGHTALTPFRAAAELSAQFWKSPFNPAANNWIGRTAAASLDLFESMTRRYGKPEWGFDSVEINGVDVPVTIEIVRRKCFGNLIHFRRDEAALARAHKADEAPVQPRVMIVAPMSGHYATLLRGTVLQMMLEHDVYITDWADARNVPLAAGRFDLNDFIDYLIDFMGVIGPKAHTMAVCQPGPPLLAAIAHMSATDDPNLPSTMTFMGSPIDARKSPTVTNLLAEEQPFEWFEQNMIQTVPAPYAGFLRRVYPGFLQLMSFMSMNSERHVDAHYEYFQNLVKGDDESADRHATFYDEYLSVCDMTEEFYLQTIRDVFQEYRLPTGLLIHQGETVRPDLITDVALMTVEGELDDISGIGQTQAAHDLCTGIPAEDKIDYVQPGVGHYGVFNGSKWRDQIQPKLAGFIKAHFDEAQEKEFLKDKSAAAIAAE